MEPAGALSLPVEIIQHISRYLSVRDVLSTSLTCYYLRVALNDDAVWRRHVPDGVASLDSREPLVEPRFCYSDSLTPLCADRVRYMRSVYVLDNVRRGRCAEYSSAINSTVQVLVDQDFSKQNQIIYGDKFIFLSYHAVDQESNRVSKRVEVWDVYREPKQHCVLRLGNIAYSVCFVIESNLVCCWKWNSRVNCRVDVYQITLPKKDFPIHYSFFVTGRKVCWQKYASRPRVGSHKLSVWAHFTVGRYLVSRSTSGEERMVIHVWDIINAVKVGSFYFPKQVSNISSQPSSSTNEWFLKGENSHNGQQYYYVFNPKEKKFSDKAFEYKSSEINSCVMFYRSKVVLIEELVYPAVQYDSSTRVSLRTANSNTAERYINCTLYDFATSKEIVKRCFNTNKVVYPVKLVEIVNGTFIMLTFNCFHFVDALTLTTLEYFECNIGFHCVFQPLLLFKSEFALVGEYGDSLCLWDIRNKRQIPRNLAEVILSGSSIVESVSEIVSIGKSSIRVAHFW